MFGVDEEAILENVNTYILVGHIKSHGQKRILKVKHETYQVPWLGSRSMDKENQVIYVWKK